MSCAAAKAGDSINAAARRTAGAMERLTRRSVYCARLEGNREVSMNRSLWIAAASLVLIGATAAPRPPSFTVDPLWPKPLPNHWLLGSVTGVAVDSHDHVFVINLTNSFTARTETGAAANPP